MVAIGLVQLKIVEGDWEGNFRRALRSMNRLVHKGAQGVVLPEMWTSLERRSRVALAQFTRDKQKYFEAWAKAHACYVMGSELEAHGGHFYNTAFVISPAGKRVGKYRKLHLFEPGGEARLFKAGSALPGVFKTPWGLWSIAICFDLRFPVMFRRLARQGVTCFVIPAQWPAKRRAHWLALLQARAIENQCVMIGVNRLGKKDGEVYSGDSVVFDAWGRRQIHLSSGRQSGLIKVDMDEVKRVRRTFPSLALDHPTID